MSRKTIVISEDGMFASHPLSFSDVLQLVCSCVSGVAKDVLDRAQESEDFEEIKGELFDAANIAFSNCLDVTFPDKELRPDLTEEAILKAENEILAERAADAEPLEVIEPIPVEPENLMAEGVEPCGDGTQN